jgi:EAL domain-containing protein (putative c-di-GMP-specific phosphodiesterase class I)
VLIHDSEIAIEKLTRLKDFGVRIAVDDFGTGYSSLGYLKRFPIDILKIDKSFIDGVGNSREEAAIADAIIKLGGSLGLEVVAEGIEEPEQVDALQSLRCERGQGFFFSKPVDAETMGEILATGRFPLKVSAEQRAIHPLSGTLPTLSKRVPPIAAGAVAREERTEPGRP